jgi:HTH-type transcriptional regulator / antitoxin HigA
MIGSGIDVGSRFRRFPLADDLNQNRPSPPPGDFIREELRRRGWMQDDLANVLGRTPARVNQIITGKQELSPEIAVELEIAFGTPAAVWLQREAAYRLSLATAQTGDVRRRTRLYELGPVRDMQRRGWIRAVDSLDDLEGEMLRFYKIGSLDEEPQLHGAMRKTAPSLPPSPAQRAWAFRVRQVAAAIPPSSVPAYNESKIDACKRDIRKLAAYSAEVRKVPGLLLQYGIRFVVVEGLPGAKVDGFATWLDDRSPVIGMSLKYDRLDNFWFTLGHELIHIQHRHAAPVDGDVCGHDELVTDDRPAIERIADVEGAAIYVPPDELNSFIRRVGPLYSTERINQFANTIKMHPNVIIGQLKHCGQIAHSKHNKTNVPIREAVVKAAVTDGWGKSFHPGVIA